jgi:signal transduction histidine kinase
LSILKVNLYPGYFIKKKEKRDILRYAISLYILSSAEYNSLNISGDSVFALSAIGEIGTAFFAHELRHIFKDIMLIENLNIKNLIVEKEIDRFKGVIRRKILELSAWGMILDEWRGFEKLDSKIILALIDELGNYIREIRNLSSEIEKYIKEHEKDITDNKGLEKYFAEVQIAKIESLEILEMLKELKQDIMQGKENDLVDVNNTLLKFLVQYTTSWRLKFDLTPNLRHIWCNPRKLSYIWISLGRNAYEAISEKKLQSKEVKVIIRTRMVRKNDKEFVEVVFSDNGPGIPEDMLKDNKLFIKGKTSKEHGTGLGLDIVYRIVKEYDGTIEARNKPEGGAEFVIQIPVNVPQNILPDRLESNQSGRESL